MTSDVIFQLQKAVYGVLAADSTLTGLVTGIYEYVPQGTGYPYLVVNEITAADWSTKTSKGASCNLLLKAYSRDMQDAVLLQIMSRATDLVRAATLTMTGHSVTNITFRDMDVKRMADGITYEATAGFKILTEES
jgi:hypothetical protein